MNDLQREKINAIYEKYGTAYIGKVNFYDDERTNLTATGVFTEYKGQLVYNFGASFVIPEIDNVLAEMIIAWNSKYPTSLTPIEKIVNRVVQLGGVNLIWS